MIAISFRKLYFTKVSLQSLFAFFSSFFTQVYLGRCKTLLIAQDYSSPAPYQKTLRCYWICPPCLSILQLCEQCHLLYAYCCEGWGTGRRTDVVFLTITALRWGYYYYRFFLREQMPKAVCCKLNLIKHKTWPFWDFFCRLIFFDERTVVPLCRSEFVYRSEGPKSFLNWKVFNRNSNLFHIASKRLISCYLKAQHYHRQRCQDFQILRSIQNNTTCKIDQARLGGVRGHAPSSWVLNLVLRHAISIILRAFWKQSSIRFNFVPTTKRNQAKKNNNNNLYLMSAFYVQ